MTDKKVIATPVDLIAAAERGDEDAKAELKKFGHQPLSASEKKARTAAEKTARADMDDQQQRNDRKAALEEKWPDAFALMDDILTRGAEAVAADRASIKKQFPKPKERAKA